MGGGGGRSGVMMESFDEPPAVLGVGTLSAARERKLSQEKSFTATYLAFFHCLVLFLESSLLCSYTFDSNYYLFSLPF